MAQFIKKNSNDKLERRDEFGEICGCIIANSDHILSFLKRKHEKHEKQEKSYLVIDEQGREHITLRNKNLPKNWWKVENIINYKKEMSGQTGSGYGDEPAKERSKINVRLKMDYLFIAFSISSCMDIP